MLILIGDLNARVGKDMRLLINLDEIHQRMVERKECTRSVQ